MLTTLQYILPLRGWERKKNKEEGMRRLGGVKQQLGGRENECQKQQKERNHYVSKFAPSEV